MTKFIQIALASFIGILFYYFREDISEFALFLCILIFGIPHGSLDYGIFKMTKRNSSKKKFIVNYLIFIFAYLLIWVINPFNGLLLFVGLSIYHFGQEHFEDLDLDDVGIPAYVVHGCFSLMVPFFFHYGELIAYVEAITSVRLPALSEATTQIVSGIFIALNILLSALLIINKALPFRIGIERILLIMFLSAVFYVLPLVQGFAIYFILFHSVNAMRHQYEWMKNNFCNYSLIKYVRDLAPFSILSYIGAGGMLMLLPKTELAQAGVFLLVFISLLTMPHMLVFDTFYSEAKKS